MEKPKDGKCNADETRKRGRPWFCGNWPEPGRKRCRRHGGQSLRGEDHPAFKHGLYTQHVDQDLAALYEAARRDPELGKLDNKIALMEVLLQAHLNKMRAGAYSAVRQDGVLKVTEEIRKLVELKDKQQERLRTHVPVGQIHSLVRALTQSIVDEVKDPVVLQRIQARVRILLRGMELTVPGPAVDTTAVAVSG